MHRSSWLGDDGLRRAAQYVRMSTEHQKYSTENQSAKIAAYAELRGLSIVRTYADNGKSGLRLEGREALKQLIADVQSGVADFETILVYDVSRWGRFQNADEGAYYEYLCNNAGITVHYCAEQFENDGSLTSTIIKNLKRAMAGEYSRELSVKVFAGQSRLTTLGFRQGGRAGFGLRRQLLDEHGRPKMVLAFGQRKSLLTDRVVLVPGPAKDVALIRKIYRQFVVEGKIEIRIAADLNAAGKVNDYGRPWNRGTVREILTNEKYLGHNLYNRTSTRLRQQTVQNPSHMWVRADNAFQGIVDPKLFESAKRIISIRNYRMSDQEMLDRLVNLLARKKRLTIPIINQDKGTPCATAYGKRFGGMQRAYGRINYVSWTDYSYVRENRDFRPIFLGVIDKLVTDARRLGGLIDCAVSQPGYSSFLSVNGEFTASISFSRHYRTLRGSPFWMLPRRRQQVPDITILGRFMEDNRTIADYLILSRATIPKNKYRVGEEVGQLNQYRHQDLSIFNALSARVDHRDLIARSMRGAKQKRLRTSAENHLKRSMREANPDGTQIAYMKVNALRLLFLDENFSTLLRAEGATSIPVALAKLLGGTIEAPEMHQISDRLSAGKSPYDDLYLVVVAGYLKRLLSKRIVSNYIKQCHPQISISLGLAKGN